MTTLTEIVASVVVHSSAVALSHFGVTLEPSQIERQPAPIEHVVARTPMAAQRHSLRLSNCPVRETHQKPLKA